MTFRISKPMYAHIQMRALIEDVSPSKVARRWLRAGAASEGFDLESLA